MTTFTINAKTTTVDLPGDTPLLWVIREHLKLTGTKYGCGISQCGACTVLLNGSAIRSCARPLSSVEGAEIITIEGLHPEGQHPLQKSWVTHQVPQCGYCQPGAILQAADLLNKNPNPSDVDIVKSMNGILCRCMTTPVSRTQSGQRQKLCAAQRIPPPKPAVRQQILKSTVVSQPGHLALAAVCFSHTRLSIRISLKAISLVISGLRSMPMESRPSTSPRRRWGNMWGPPWPKLWLRN